MNTCEKSEPCGHASAEGQREEFKPSADWLNTLKYIHKHTSTVTIYYTCVREENRRSKRGVLVVHNFGYTRCQEPNYRVKYDCTVFTFFQYVINGRP